VHEQLAQEQDIPDFAQTLAERDRVCFSVRPHDVCGQLGAAGRWAAVAASTLGTIAVLLVWATAVMGSRLALGMHWPLDLVVATLISWLLVTLATG
jgi:phosphatidylglycerophosphatase B